MKRLFLFSVALTSILFGVSCSEDSSSVDGGGDTSAVAVPLSYELSATSAQAGDEIVATFKVTSDAVTEEDVTITLTAIDGTTDVSATYFVDFPGSVTFPKGSDEFSVTLALKEDFTIEGTYKAVELRAYSRGYTISGGTSTSAGEQSLTVRIYDEYVTTVVLANSATEVTEGETFALEASIPVASDSDVVVAVAYSGEEFVLTNLPESITIVAGETSAKSEAVTVELDGIYAGDITITLDLSTESTVYPLESETVALKVKDVDIPLGDAAQDERWVYDSPSTMFVSSANIDAVTNTWGKSNYVEMAKGSAHPNEELASTWSFYTSYEFHDIAGFYTENATYNTKLVKGFAANNTVLFESVAAVNINQFSTITNEGHLNMWVQKVQTATTGTSNATRDYGTAAFYTSKFSAAQDDASKCWATNLVRILPGTRIETRAKVTGQKKGINTAIWLQGSASSTLAWPLYGEVDIMENPASSSNDNVTHYTYHIGESGSTYANPTASNTINSMSDFNIYWFEYIDESTVAIGVNGQEMNRITKADYPSVADWPFDSETNPYGLYYILTFGVASEWALGTAAYDGWDSGFSSFTNYAEDRFNADLPRMEIDWVRFYTASNYDDSKPVNSSILY